MKETLRLFGKVVIMMFCVWHMAAVAIYALPGMSNEEFVHRLQERFGPVINPYLLLTSQWQQWNLFSPDPLRRVTSYAIDVQKEGEWHEIEYITAGSLPWWRHAAQFKMLGSLLDGDTQNQTQHNMAERYLQLRCDMYNILDGTPIRLMYKYYIIPAENESMSVEDWWNYAPEESAYVGHEAVCQNIDIPRL